MDGQPEMNKLMVIATSTATTTKPARKATP
jgi:hypothetical protein